MNILILDDEEMIRESLAVYFESRGASVFTAASAEEALAILAGTELDAAVVDIRLPGMNGNEFLRRAFEQRPGMRVVVHTGSVDYTVPREVIAAGTRPVAVFQKPVYDLADIYDAVAGKT